jgi:hypothetical protein
VRVPLNEPLFDATNPLTVLRGKQVYIYEAGTTNEAVIYATETDAAQLTQPLVTDKGGRPEKDGTTAWVEVGSYDLVWGEQAVRWNAVSGAASGAATADVAVIKEAPLNVQYPEYGVVGDGSADDTAAIEKAVAALKSAQKGELLFPPGIYKLSKSGLLPLDYPGQSIIGGGQSATILKPTAAVTGKIITRSTMPASDRPSGVLSGFQIDGENAGDGAVAYSMGDLVGASHRDFTIRNFTKTNQKAIEGRNGGYWTEECVWDNVTLDNNKVNLELSRAEAGNTSFGYNTFQHLRLNVFAGQTGIRLKGDVKLYNTFLRLTANLHGVGCVGLELAETSQLWGLLAIAMETNEAGAAPIKVAAGAVLKGTGYVHTAEGGGISENAGTNNILLSGFIKIPGIKSSELFRATGPVKNIKPAAEATTKEVVEALEEIGLVQ